MKRKLIFCAKLAFTILAIWLVYTQVDLDKILFYINNIDMLYAVLALFMLNIGQVASGLRMRFYFHSAGLQLARIFAIALYYVGMLFNLILPGGIGGDGYKAYYLKSNFDFPLRTSLRLIISGRASGLLLLIFFTFVMCFFSEKILKISDVVKIEYLLVVAIIGLFISYYLCAKYILKEKLSIQIGASLYSSIVQGSVVLTVILLLKSLGHEANIIEYIILFMISTVVSILPISIGGVGLREATFFYLAPFLALSGEVGVTLSLLYFVVNAVASLFGAIGFYWMKSVKL